MKQSSETLTSLSSVNKAFIEPFPNSKKVYAKGSRDDINVPMRQIKLTDTIGDLAEKNDPIHVYDTSGPYTDPTKSISYRDGIDSVRSNWIEERGDTEVLDGVSSNFSTITKICLLDVIGRVLLLFLRRTIDSLTACLAMSL